MHAANSNCRSEVNADSRTVTVIACTMRVAERLTHPCLQYIAVCGTRACYIGRFAVSRVADHTHFDPTSIYQIAAMDPKYVEEKKEEVAQERFDKSFDELEPHDRIKVGGSVGGSLRGGQLADPDRAPEPPKVKFGEDNPAPGEKKA